MTAKRTKREDMMVSVSSNYRKNNTARVAKLAKIGLHTRLEFDRSTDLPLVTMCLRKEPPAHVLQVQPGIYAVDLPADVFKTVWMIDGGFAVGTYRTRGDRDGDL